MRAASIATSRFLYIRAQAIFPRDNIERFLANFRLRIAGSIPPQSEAQNTAAEEAPSPYWPWTPAEFIFYLGNEPAQRPKRTGLRLIEARSDEPACGLGRNGESRLRR
jgi:hypothetical protein